MKYFNFSDKAKFDPVSVGRAHMIDSVHITRTLSDCELFFVLGGDVYIEQDKTKYHLKKGDYFLSESNVSYGGYRPATGEFLWVHFTCDECCFSEKRESDNSLPQYGNVGTGDAVSVTFSLVNCYFYVEGKEKVVCELVKAILLDICEMTCPKEAKTGVKDKRFQSVIDYFHCNPYFNETRDIRSMAEFFGYSEKYFIRLFKKYVGCSPVQYLTKRKILRAQEMLVNTDMTVKAIALSLNYDEYYFIKLFKKNVGITPNQYRKTIAFNFEKIIDTPKNEG